jgi:hypothetical protein
MQIGIGEVPAVIGQRVRLTTLAGVVGTLANPTGAATMASDLSSRDGAWMADASKVDWTRQPRL